MELLTCEGLTKNYGSLTALDHVDLHITEGKIIGLLGPNGSGKTTLIKLINGLLTLTSGEIRINGDKPGVSTKAVISYLSDKNDLPDWMSVNDLLTMYEDFFNDFDRKRADEMLELLNIPSRQIMKKMSKGTREKVRLILTMSRRAKLYLLDEPIAGVDPAARDYILRTILSNYDEDATVVISTHLIQDVEPILSEAIFLKDGQIVLHKMVDDIREETGMSVDSYFREVFKC